MAGYERMAAMAAESMDFDDDRDLSACEQCGSPTVGEVCRSCELVEQVT